MVISRNCLYENVSIKGYLYLKTLEPVRFSTLENNLKHQPCLQNLNIMLKLVLNTLKMENTHVYHLFVGKLGVRILIVTIVLLGKTLDYNCLLSHRSKDYRASKVQDAELWLKCEIPLDRTPFQQVTLLIQQ